MKMKEYKMYNECKYCISPKIEIAKYWLSQRGINYRTVKILTREEQIRGNCDITRDNTLVVFGRDFDFPEVI